MINDNEILCGAETSFLLTVALGIQCNLYKWGYSLGCLPFCIENYLYKWGMGEHICFNNTLRN